MKSVLWLCILFCLSTAHGQISDLQLEREKLDIQRQTLEVEREKARWSAISSTVPILAALATVVYGVWSLKRTATVQLATKLAELSMEGPSPVEIVTRARIVHKLFAELLPPDFADRLATIDEKELPHVRQASNRKIELLRLLTEHPDQREQIRRDHLALWGKDPLDRAAPPPSG
jgi:hypothetical protein